MLPVLGREVVEGEQHVAILDQALGRLVIFDAPGLDEGVEGRKRILLVLGHPDFLQRPLGFRLLALRQFVEDVGGFVHPPALAARLGPDLFDRLPESKRAIGDRELARRTFWMAWALDYQEFIGAKKHLVLRLLSQNGTVSPQMSQHSTSVADRAQLLSSGVLVVRDFWDPGSVRVIQGNSTALGLRARQQLETISASGCSIADWV